MNVVKDNCSIKLAHPNVVVIRFVQNVLSPKEMKNDRKKKGGIKKTKISTSKEKSSSFLVYAPNPSKPSSIGFSPKRAKYPE